MTAADDGWVTAQLQGAGFVTTLAARDHAFVADEPLAVGGTDTAVTPYELLLGAIAACTAMTMRVYAKRKGWPLDTVVVRLRSARSHAADCETCETAPVGVGTLERIIDITGALDHEQRARLLQIADKCPVKQSIERGIRIAGKAADGAA